MRSTINILPEENNGHTLLCRDQLPGDSFTLRPCDNTGSARAAASLRNTKEKPHPQLQRRHDAGEPASAFGLGAEPSPSLSAGAFRNASNTSRFFSAGLSCAPIPAAVPTSKSHFLQLLFLLPVTLLSCSTEACCHIARIFLAFQSFVLKLFSLFFSQTWQMNVNRAAAHLHGILHLKLLFRLGFRNDKHQAADGGSKQKEPKRNEMAICHS